MKLLTSKTDIAAVEDRPSREFPVPEWGEDVGVLLREPTGADRDAYQAQQVDVDASDAEKPGVKSVKLDNFRARLVALCIVDEQGARVYTSEADVTLLASKGAKALERLYNECQGLVSLGKKAADDLEKK